MLTTRCALLPSVLFLASVAALGCSAEEPDVDPTSREALKKAETFPHGCNYVKEVSKDDNGKYSKIRTPACATTRCGDLEPPDTQNYGASVGGYTYFSSETTFYTDREDFVGTCDDPQPLSCDYLTEAGDACSACAAKSCCTPVYFCDHDPNCKSILDCVNGCDADAACQTRCLDNGDAFAAANVRDVAACLRNRCEMECLGE